MNRGKCFSGIAVLIASLTFHAMAGEWPVLKTYEGEHLARVKMPLGGIGTGTISLSGRGSLVDWELAGHPHKGNVPRTGFTGCSTHFAIRVETADGQKVARLLEGPLRKEEFEGFFGCPTDNQGFPRFRKAVFGVAYPLATLDLEDPAVPVGVRLEAMNPLVKGDASASGIPAALFRWKVKNPQSTPVKVSIVCSLVDVMYVELAVEVAEGVGRITEASKVYENGWNVSVDRYWRRFLAEGTVGDAGLGEKYRKPIRQKCVTVEIAPGEEKAIPFAIGWRCNRRFGWEERPDGLADDDSRNLGNFYATEYKSAAEAAKRLLTDGSLEAKTIAFVNEVMASPAPDVVKEAALFNLSTLRTETCFRTADGHFYGWEGCADIKGSCFGSCTHVWGYEHALVDIWPDLARDMLDLQFGPQLSDEGWMAFRVGLPLETQARKSPLAAADGQMQCIIKACEYWKKSGDADWLRRTWPAIRRAQAFCWVPGGWDADCDGVMEGCQHNTMDVEYFGPNPQMGFLYLAALEASAAMGEVCGDNAFAEKCRGLCARGKDWIEKNLFNGDYYEHKIVPVKGEIVKQLRHSTMGSRTLDDPDYQLGAGCLIDQLLGEFSARAAGLPSVVDEAHAKKTLATIVAKCRKAPDDSMFNPMRGYAMAGEESLRMAWYPQGRMPNVPFPYYVETMTGFEYVVAALLAEYGDFKGAERVVRNIRNRYDGLKRNPFNEAECGHHYARAMAAWSVLRAFE